MNVSLIEFITYVIKAQENAFNFSEDLTLGMYKLSQTKKGMKQIFNIIPKEAHQYIEKFKDSKFTGSELSKMLSILLDKLPTTTYATMLNKLAHISHNEAKLTVSLTDYATATKDNIDNPVTLMVDAGARGKWSQVKQINETRGFISDVEGRVIPTIISSSLLEGLTPNEYFVSAYGGIKGIIDSSRNTAISGYLTRRLIYLVSNIELSEDVWDCGSTNYLKLSYNDENKNMFLYRVIKLDPQDDNEIILTKDNINDFIDKTIYLRSPMTCKCKDGKICHKCYGYLFKKHNSKMIGYISAQSMGERAAQLTLRTKHTSGATDMTLPDWISIEDGFIKTTVPTTIISNNDGIVIINSNTNEEVDLPYSSVDVISENSKQEIIKSEDNEITDFSVFKNNGLEDDDIEEGVMNITNSNDTVKYTISDIGNIAKIFLMSHDVVAAVGDFGKFLKKLPKYAENASMSDILLMLIDKLGITSIHSVHYELLLSMFARSAKDTNILFRNDQENGLVWFKENEVLDNMLLQSMIFERSNG